MKYAGIIFDLDGVICSTDEYHYLAWKALADRLGIAFDRTINNRLRGMGRMESLEVILERSGKVYTQAQKIAFAAEKNDLYRTLLRQMSTADLAADVKDTLIALRAQGKKLAIGSSSKNTPFILERLGLHDFFDAVVDGNSITHAKPHPEVFLKAAAMIGLEPEACLVVEDAKAGIEAAVAGGFDCAGMGDAKDDPRVTWPLEAFDDLLHMKGILPEYLRMRADARPNEAQAFVCGDVRFTVITPRLIRIEQGVFTDEATLVVLRRGWTPCACDVSERDGVFTLRTDALEIAYDPLQPLAEGLTIRHLGHPAFVCRYGQKPLQNLGGTRSTLDVADGACAIGDGVCSVDGFAWIDDSTSPLLREDGWFAPRAACSDLYFFGYGHDYLAAVRDYCHLTGRVQMLPAFALGNWWSRYYAYTQEGYLALMDRFAREDVPLSVAIVDMDWHLTDGDGRSYHDGWTGYTWNEALFPDYKAFIQGLHARGLKTALNLHPADGVRAHEKQYEAMARAMGEDPAAGKTIPCNWLSPEYLKAYFDVLHFPYERDGVDFWWLDWQQGSDFNKLVGADKDDGGLRSITPLWMLNHMHFLASQREGKRGMIFSRFAGYGSQRYPIGFSGDTYVTWASLRFQPYFTATASNIGYGWWSHDIGGHMGGVRDDELAARWIQFGVFSPIFRLHSSNSVFNCREPWTYNPRSEQTIKRFMRLRHQLFPYIYTMNARCEAEQKPLIMPMYYTHPEEKAAYEAKNEYWFGSEMIAAPITQPMDESALAAADVFFPEGVWTDLFTGDVYRGGRTMAVCRALEEMPVFLKAGAIVPMQAHTPGDWSLGHAARMTVAVAPGADGAFTLWEDDGQTLAYRNGKVSRTPLTFKWTEGRAQLTIGAADDAAGVVPQKRSWTVDFIGFAGGCSVCVDGRAVSAAYLPERHVLRVTLDDAPTNEAIVVTIAHDTALMHGGEDAAERCIDLITRAQIPLTLKTQLHQKLDASAARLKKGQNVRKGDFGTDCVPTLGLALFEQMTRLCEEVDA